MMMFIFYMDNYGNYRNPQIFKHQNNHSEYANQLINLNNVNNSEHEHDVVTGQIKKRE